MLKQTPEIQGEALKTWQKLGAISVDFLDNLESN